MDGSDIMKASDYEYVTTEGSLYRMTPRKFRAYLKAVAVVAAHGTMSEEYLTLTDEALTTIAKLVWPKEDG